MKPKETFIQKMAKLFCADWGLYFARRSGRPVPLREIVELTTDVAADLGKGFFTEEMKKWLEKGEVHFSPPPPEPEELTPRKVAFWLCQQAGADWKRRTKILQVLRALHRAWPGES